MNFIRLSTVTILTIMVSFSILSYSMADAHSTISTFQWKKTRSKDHIPVELEKRLTENLKNLRKDIESRHGIHL